MADIIYAIRPAYCLFSLTRCLQPKRPSTDGERQAQLLDDDTSPLGLALSAGVHPFFISVHGSMIVLSGLSLIPELPSLLLDSLLGQQASQPPSQPLWRVPSRRSIPAPAPWPGHNERRA